MKGKPTTPSMQAACCQSDKKWCAEAFVTTVTWVGTALAAAAQAALSWLTAPLSASFRRILLLPALR